MRPRKGIGFVPAHGFRHHNAALAMGGCVRVLGAGRGLWERPGRGLRLWLGERHGRAKPRRQSASSWQNMRGPPESRRFEAVRRFEDRWTANLGREIKWYAARLRSTEFVQATSEGKPKDEWTTPISRVLQILVESLGIPESAVI
jgi:hypothetical protein